MDADSALSQLVEAMLGQYGLGNSIEEDVRLMLTAKERAADRLAAALSDLKLAEGEQ